MHADPHGLQRFIDAQAPVYSQVRAELVAGRKTSHWMWFVFPQIAGLGQSAMSQRFALRGVDDAVAYAAHPVLGARLRECTSIVLGLRGITALTLFGSPDDLKFRSCMTLFSRCVGDPCFEKALNRGAGGRPDEATLRLLAAGQR